MRRGAGLAVFGALAALCGGGAFAATRTLTVANLNQQGLVYIELQNKEGAATVLSAAANEYPLRVLSVSVRMGVSIVSTRGHRGTGTVRLNVWRDTGAVEPGERLYESPNPVTVMTGDNTFDLRGADVVVDRGAFRVGIEIVQEGADPVVDQDGQTANRNFVLGKQSGTMDTFRWQASPSSLLAGDFIISAEIETALDGGGARADAGLTADAGTTDGSDAGQVGADDAGASAQDAGRRVDGGVRNPSTTGCSCDASHGRSSGYGLLVVSALALAALGVRRRRREPPRA